MRAIIVVDMWKHSREPRSGYESDYCDHYHKDNIVLAELINRILSHKQSDTDLYYTHYNNQTENEISPTITDIPGIKPLNITGGTIDTIPDYEEYLLCGSSLGICMHNYHNQIQTAQPNSTTYNIINLSLPYPGDTEWNKPNDNACTLYYGDIKYWKNG